MPYQRVGKCGMCGQCCGADGSPNQDNPYPRYFADQRRNADVREELKRFPQLSMCGLRTREDGRPYLPEDTGKTKVSMNDGTTKEFYWFWHEGMPCKATADGQFKSLECPFLLDDPGDGTRPCGLVGSKREDAYRAACHTTDANGGIPPLEIQTKEQVDQWHKDHPKCKPSEENSWIGFGWIEVDTG